MNYLRTYCNLIRKAEQRGYTKKKAKEQGVYVEGHHTFPVSIFGKNKRIVYLTAREHYIAHALLERVCIKRYGLKHQRTYKMIWAHVSMTGKNKLTKERYHNSYLYEAARLRISEIEFSEEIKQKMSAHRRKSKWWNNGVDTKFCEECPGPEWKRGRPGINVGRIYSEKTIEKMRIKATGRKVSEENKRQRSIKNKNKIWWNNGIKNKFSRECPGPEWKKGRGFYWTNGKEETVSIACPGTEWRKGRIPGILKGKFDDFLYWNNGEKTIRVKKCPGEEWKRGRLPEGTYWWNDGTQNLKSKNCPGKEWSKGLIKNETTKNCKWWNDGHFNKMHKECPGEGWVRGMIKRT